MMLVVRVVRFVTKIYQAADFFLEVIVVSSLATSEIESFGIDKASGI